jgi:hypothetical protein
MNVAFGKVIKYSGEVVKPSGYSMNFPQYFINFCFSSISILGISIIAFGMLKLFSVNTFSSSSGTLPKRINFLSAFFLSLKYCDVVFRENTVYKQKSGKNLRATDGLIRLIYN